jgi:F-type H+-transporting ATPase subunit b
MQQMLESVQQLLVLALPTFIVVVLLYHYLRTVLFLPLEKTLDERKAATSGTRRAADESLKKAEQKAAEYEDKLRAARGEIYKDQEEIRRKWREEQTASMAEARTRTDSMIKEARQRLDERKAEAKAGLEAESETLAETIARTVLSGRSL